MQLCEASEVELLILDLRDEDAYQKCRLCPGEPIQKGSVRYCKGICNDGGLWAPEGK